MNDKEFEQQKKRIKKLFEKWRQPLGLSWWRITLAYEREPKRDKADAPEHLSDIESKWDCLFETRSDYYYKTAIITCYLSIIKNIKDEELERYFIHEAMHIYLAPMDHHKAEEELVATSLADMVLWVVESKIELTKNK